jgi:Pyruvate/2-oxoacid:ferredoxin oxidoreductase gamma subunit
MKSVCFIGRGGQGIVFSAEVLARAAFLKGKYVAQLQSYGAEVRGGSVMAYAVIDEKPIDNPFIEDFDLIVLLSHPEEWMYIVSKGKHVISDEPVGISMAFPFSRLSRDQNLKENSLALGLVSALGYASLEFIEKALPKGKDFEENMRAVKIGFEETKKLYKSSFQGI